MDNGTEPIADEELLYRRVPQVWYNDVGGLNSLAFAPHKINDVTGVSLYRAKYKSSEEAAKVKNRPGKSYYVAVLRTGDLRQKGIEVVPRPLPNDPGHAELPDINSANRKTGKTLQRQQALTSLCLRVEGPFRSSDE